MTFLPIPSRTAPSSCQALRRIPSCGPPSHLVHTRSLHNSNQEQPTELIQEDVPTARPMNSARSKALLLSSFHKSLGTQDIDTIWPVYRAMHRNNLAHHLSRRVYRNIFLYTIHAKATIQNLQRLLYIIGDMKAHGMKLRLTEYNALIRWTGGKTVPRPREQHLSEALALLDELQQQGSTTTSSTTFLSSGIQPDVVTYNTLISIACSVSDLRTAQKLYHEMKAKKLQPNIRTYTSLLSALARVHDVSAMETMVEQIRKKGIPNIDNTVTWNALMAGYAMNGMADNVHDMFRQMVDRVEEAPAPDAETFRVYIESLLYSHRLADALGCLRTMDTHDIKPIAAIYNAFFLSLTRKGKARVIKEDHATSAEKTAHILVDLYESMKKHQVQPNSKTMQGLITALLDNGATDKALNIFVELSQQGNQPDVPFDLSLPVKQLTQLKLAKKPTVAIVPESQLVERLHLLLSEQEQSLDQEQPLQEWDSQYEDFEPSGETAVDFEQTHVYCQ
ncbi:hypothetical protein INT44_005958 [Umbelopsis vinacea]|uniref:Pentacotripeptide-repeat region of PRORP domain-containing protein n=1 Tax=Umbelopsis vinacea TaxID=44442 RepID=A0A8H7UII0_9FUNG|nr:hypothetical protein INT44_005958 [Umbelopsis vinacea]